MKATLLKICCVLMLTGAAGSAAADPARLSNAPSPVVVARGVSTQDVQNAIVGLMMPMGRMPVRQDANLVAFEFPLSFWQSFGVQMAQGNSGWQEPKGRLTFTMAQQGPDAMVGAQFETIATNAFNASNSIAITNNVVYNELFLQLQLIAALAEGRFAIGDHNALGITEYVKPTRKSKKLGAVIKGLVPGGPAQRAGLVPGDIVTAIGGMPTAEQSMDTLRLMGYLQEGVAVLQVQGKGEIRVVKAVRPGSRSAEHAGQGATGAAVAPTSDGSSATPKVGPR